MDVKQLLANNRFWSESLRARDPDFFARLANQQRPEFLWVGCSDSRVPANEVVGLMPDEQRVDLLCELNVQRQVRRGARGSEP